MRVVDATGTFSWGTERVFDSKAARKVEEGQTAITVVETAATGVSEGVVFRAAYRCLLKMH